MSLLNTGGDDAGGQDASVLTSNNQGSAPTQNLNALIGQSNPLPTATVTPNVDPALVSSVLSQLATSGTPTQIPTSLYDLLTSSGVSSSFAAQVTNFGTGCYNPQIQFGPIIQNATDWSANGCDLGFYCPNNDASHLPVGCVANGTCAGKRLGTQVCIPQGTYEPGICPEGFYCPQSEKQPIQCPAGSYCPLGSYQATKCSVGASCPAGSKKDMSYLPLIFLILIDVALVVTAAVLHFRAARAAKLRALQKDNSMRRKTKVPTSVKALDSEYDRLTGTPEEPDYNQSPNTNVPPDTRYNAEYHPENGRGMSMGNRTNSAYSPYDISMNARYNTGYAANMATDTRNNHGYTPYDKRSTAVDPRHDTGYFPVDERDIGMNHDDSNISLRRKPTVFEELGDHHEFDMDEHIEEINSGDVSTDLHLFVASLSKCLGATKFGLSFEYEDLQFQPPKSAKPILSQVSGKINAGSLWGVMGASGAGKSTFVNVLMGKTAHTGGVTKVNGVPGSIEKYKKIIGYVPQDDIVLGELTVRENILHSARIRLPSSWSEHEIQHHVDILINCLQLSHVKDSLVGTPGAPVISGGQRKRVSIGMELAAAPMAVFLDEPTSGLDATSAASILSTLKALSRLGMTIVVIIHQPRQEIFESLDSLVLLGAGRTIYQGPEKEMQAHFERLGFHFPEHHNPADIMGDIIAGEGRQYKKHGDASIYPLIDYWQSHQRFASPERALKGPNASVMEMNAMSQTIHGRGALWYKQLYFCFTRSIVQQYRTKSAFFFEMGVGALAGFLIGLAYLSQGGDNFRGVFIGNYKALSSAVQYSSVPQMALLVAIAIGLTASAPSVKLFGEEKLMYWREAAAGHNRFMYYMGKVLSTLPRLILACLHFTVLFMLLATPKISWGAAFCANLLYFYCIYGLASIISMITRREDGPLLAVMSSLIVGVLSGASPSLNKIRSWHMAWLWRCSPGTWLAEGYFDRNLHSLSYLYDVGNASDQTGYLMGHFVRDCLMMLLIGTIYRIVAFLGLRFLYPSKQR